MSRAKRLSIKLVLPSSALALLQSGHLEPLSKSNAASTTCFRRGGGWDMALTSIRCLLLIVLRVSYAARY